MMIGQLDLGVIALGIFVAWVAPFVFIMAVMTTDAPGSSPGPAYIILGTGVALIALIAWWVDHPFQFLGGIALAAGGFVTYVALSNLKEYLQRRRGRAASPAPVHAKVVETEAGEPIAARQTPRPQPTGRPPATPPKTVRCRLIWNGSEVAHFLDVHGLPSHTDPRTPGGVPPDALPGGRLTFLQGSSANRAFVDWCRSGGAAVRRDGAEKSVAQRTLEIGVEVLSERDVYAAIALHGAAVARVELVAAPQADDKTTYIPLLEVQHAG